MFIEFNIYHRMTDLDQHFQDEESEMLIFRNPELVKKMQNDFYRFCYLPSNGSVANFELHDLDLHLQDKKIGNA